MGWETFETKLNKDAAMSIDFETRVCRSNLGVEPQVIQVSPNQEQVSVVNHNAPPLL